MNEDAVLDTPLWDDTWLPVPKLDIEPNGPLKLLNIILDPKDPCNEHKLISTHDPNIAFNITEFEYPNMDNTERLLTRGVSNAQYPEIYGRGDAVSLDCFCKSLKKTTVNNESVLESILTRATEPRVREALRDIRLNPAPRPIYIITGIKVATGGTWIACGVSGRRKGHVWVMIIILKEKTVVDLLQNMGRVEAPLVETE
ncbi:hypothetical protein AtubIFM57143_007510 [Aspergillus tubingensis]|nr:hypothetical protein AtubIFM57143_007510 [Aspergillus tubingensis]